MDTALAWLCQRRTNYAVLLGLVRERIGDAGARPPVMVATYLEPLDRQMEAPGLTCARFMDDWVILAPAQWGLRRSVGIVNETLPLTAGWSNTRTRRSAGLSDLIV